MPTAKLATFATLLLAFLTGSRSSLAGEASPHHRVYDLLANRAHAHLLRGGGIAVDAGAWSFPRYVDGNIGGQRWRFAVEDGGRKVAHARTRQVHLHLPLTGAEAGRTRHLSLRLRPARAGRKIRLKLNGKALDRRTTRAGWQTLSWALPKGGARAGENDLALDFGGVGKIGALKGGGRLAWLSLGAAPSSGDADLDLSLGDARALRIPGGGGLAWYLFIPKEARLRVETLGGLVACSMDLSLRGPGGHALRKTVSVGGGAGAAVAILEPDPLAGDVARLEIRAAPECQGARLTAGALEIPGPAPSYERTAEAPDRILLYIIDTLRADRLKAYNPRSRVRTPNLDRLIQEGTVFLQAYAQGNESYVSHAAIFTGQYPRRNRVFTGNQKLRGDQRLLSEAIRKLGVRTAGFSSNGYIDVRNGYLQGWDHYVNTLIQKRPYLAPGLHRQVRAWIEKRSSPRWMLYVGTVDPHVSYRAHAGTLERYDTGAYNGPFRKSCSGAELGKIKGGSIRPTARDKARIEALYDNEVDFADQHLGAFLDWLEERNLLDDTLVVVTSDHGDEFWEHGGVGHGHTLYDELIHVPLIVRYPPLFPAGARVLEGVDTIDIFPTLVDALKGKVGGGLQGASLIPLAHGRTAGYPRPSVASRHAVLYAMRIGRYKIHLARRGRIKVYDLKKDPREKKEVAASRPLATRWLRDCAGLFVAYEKEWSKRDWGVASNLLGIPGGR